MLKLGCFRDKLYVYLEAGKVKKTKSKVIEYILPEIEELNENGFTLKQICESINDNDCFFHIEINPLKTAIARIRKKHRSSIEKQPLTEKINQQIIVSEDNRQNILVQECNWEEILGFEISKRCLTRLIKSNLTSDFITKKEFPNEKRLSDFLIKHELTNKHKDI